MSGAEETTDRPFTLGVRWVEGQIDRAQLRTTLTYRLHPRVLVGVEYNPLANDATPLANILAVSETATRPAVIVGTSSDRIGTPHGQSFYLTASKNLRRETGFPIAPYAGVAYGTYDDELVAIGGLAIDIVEDVEGLIIFDGDHVHPTVSYTFDRHVLTLLLIRGHHFGVSYSIQF